MPSTRQFPALASAGAMLAQLWISPASAYQEPVSANDEVASAPALSAWAGGLLSPRATISKASFSGRPSATFEDSTSSESRLDVLEWMHSLGTLAISVAHGTGTEIRPPANTNDPSMTLAVNADWAGLAIKVQSWVDLPNDWDGDEAVPPSRAVVDAATAFAYRAGYRKLPSAQLYIAGDGEIGFRWVDGTSFASVAFLDDGSMVVYCSPGVNEVAVKLDVPFDDRPDLNTLFDRLAHFVSA